MTPKLLLENEFDIDRNPVPETPSVIRARSFIHAVGYALAVCERRVIDIEAEPTNRELRVICHALEHTLGAVETDKKNNNANQNGTAPRT